MVRDEQVRFLRIKMAEGKTQLTAAACMSSTRRPSLTTNRDHRGLSREAEASDFDRGAHRRLARAFTAAPGGPAPAARPCLGCNLPSGHQVARPSVLPRVRGVR